MEKRLYSLVVYKKGDKENATYLKMGGNYKYPLELIDEYTAHTTKSKMYKSLMARGTINVDQTEFAIVYENEDEMELPVIFNNERFSAHNEMFTKCEDIVRNFYNGIKTKMFESKKIIMNNLKNNPNYNFLADDMLPINWLINANFIRSEAKEMILNFISLPITDVSLKNQLFNAYEKGAIKEYNSKKPNYDVIDNLKKESDEYSRNHSKSFKSLYGIAYYIQKDYETYRNVWIAYNNLYDINNDYVFKKTNNVKYKQMTLTDWIGSK